MVSHDPTDAPQRGQAAVEQLRGVGSEAGGEALPPPPGGGCVEMETANHK